MRVTLYVGTSGWAYSQWKPGFYPSKVPQSRFLEHYAGALTACEVNATFYRSQSPQTFAKWAGQVPDGFRFALKAHRSFSMRKDMALDDYRRAILADFLRSASPLGKSFGILLFSYPKHVEPDRESLAGFLDEFPPEPRCALEFRSERVASEMQDVVAASGACMCLTDWSGEAPDALPPGPHAYVRLRAPRYGDTQRSAWRALLEREARRRDVYAFVKHEEAGTGDEWAGLGLARWLVSKG
ncbi:hypothetical protein BH18ACT15_BH18ACT15_00890 [soil metagenome]